MSRRLQTLLLVPLFIVLARPAAAQVDECAEEPGPCDENATCADTEDAFTCECLDGFIGDGTACAADADGDGIADDVDNCPDVENAEQADLDTDLIGDACDDDVDGDGLSNADEDDVGTDPLRFDSDGDGLFDSVDPQPLTDNTPGEQVDSCGCASLGGHGAVDLVWLLLAGLASRLPRPRWPRRERRPRH